MQASYASYRSAKFVIPVLLLAAVVLTAQVPPSPPVRKEAPAPMSAQAREQAQQILRGRQLVLHHGCGDCHGGYANPNAAYYLAGVRDSLQVFQIGPFKTYPRNLTPDNATGMGRFSERQIFNAMRYGLRPGETPDVAITGSTPGQGGFPANPKYLAPPMPWPAFRHMSDQELMDIAAYLKRGLKPVSNRVMDSEGPPDFWAGEYTVEKYGPHPAAAFPGSAERPPQP